MSKDGTGLGLDGGGCGGGEKDECVGFTEEQRRDFEEAGSHIAPNRPLSGLRQRTNFHLYRFRDEREIYSRRSRFTLISLSRMRFMVAWDAGCTTGPGSAKVNNVTCQTSSGRIESKTTNLIGVWVRNHQTGNEPGKGRKPRTGPII